MTDSPTNTKTYLKAKLKASLEAKKIARLNEEVAAVKLKELKKKGKKLSGIAKESNKILVSTLKEEINKKIEAHDNMSYGDTVEGGVGYGGCGGSGTDAG